MQERNAAEQRIETSASVATLSATGAIGKGRFTNDWNERSSGD